VESFGGCLDRDHFLEFGEQSGTVQGFPEVSDRTLDTLGNGGFAPRPRNPGEFLKR
jgi:hypothetical protein